MKVIFKKKGYFKGNNYNKGEVCEMTSQSAKIYKDFGTVKEYFGNKNKENEVIDLAEYSYKKLQELCKEKNLKYSGKKDELITILKNNGVS